MENRYTLRAEEFKTLSEYKVGFKKFLLYCHEEAEAEKMAQTVIDVLKLLNGMSQTQIETVLDEVFCVEKELMLLKID